MSPKFVGKIVNKILSLISKKHKLITLIFLLGLFLRLLGTYPGYPLTHPDEPTIATPSIRMVFEGNFRPQNYYYGSLLSLIYAATYIVFFIPLGFIFVLPQHFNTLIDGLPGFFTFLQTSPPLHLQTPLSINYWARYDSAILSSLTVLAAYLVGKKLFNKPIALLAAFLVAINYRHVLSSRLILADAPAAFFALFAIYFFIKLLRKPTMKNYIFSGIALGLALSVKYFAYVIPAFLLCHLLASWEKSKNHFSKLVPKLLHHKLILSLVITGGVFILINPYLIIAREEAAYFWQANSARYGLKLSLETLKSQNFSYYSLYYLFHYGLGPILSILTISGLAWSLIRHTKATLIISSVALPYIYIFLVISGTGMVRNYAAVIPLLLFFPATLIYALAKRIKPKTIKIITVITILTASSYQHLEYSLVSGWNLAKEQNMISLHNWLASNIPVGSKILGPSGIFYPTQNSLEAVKVTLEGNNFPSIQEITQSGTPWIIAGAMPADVTESLLTTNDITKKIFFDDKNLIPNLTSNFYNTLVFRELADYRLVEFAKPLTQDPPFLVAEIPESWKIKKDVLAANFDFGDGIANWQRSSYPIDSYDYSTLNNSLIVKQGSAQCKSLFSKISSPKINIDPNKWYSLSAIARRNMNPSYKTTRNGFFHLDFYGENDELLKTYVTAPLSARDGLQELNAAGFAPENSKYARVSFSIDSCLDSEVYLIDDISLFVAKEFQPINENEYPYYMKSPTLFEWLPQL